MKKIILILSLFFGAIGAWAQIPAEVTDVMNHCRAAMNNASGLEYEADMKVGIGPLAMKMHFVIANKGDLNRTCLNMKVLGEEVVVESGFDGTDTWEIKHSSKSDTIIFNHGNTRNKSKGDLDLDLDHKYNKAKMKLNDGYYEITFSDPKDKDNEVKRVTAKISAKNYTMREIRTSARGASVTMNVTKIHVGLKDSHFKPDLSKYSNAVIIRK